MKKAIVVTTALTLALSGCGLFGGEPKTEEKKEETKVEATQSEEAKGDDAEATDQQSSSSISWVKATSTAAAAQGAGFSTFGVPASIKIGELEYKDPQFSYAGGVAQAVYDTPATQLTIRKGSSARTTPMTDRDKTEFASKESKTIEGLDVTLYGATAGSATVISWTDGSFEYAVTDQGLGGEEMTMSADEVATIVRDIKAANADATTTNEDGTDTQQTTTQQTTTTENETGTETTTEDTSGYVSEDDAKQAAISALSMGVPESVTVNLVKGGDAPHYDLIVSYGSEAYEVLVGAQDGLVWDMTATDVPTDTAGSETSATTDEDGGEESASYISEQDAKDAAVSALGLGLPDEVNAELVVGGDAPHYVVSLNYGTEPHEVEVDAISGQVW